MDIITVLTAAKEAGFEVGSLIGIGVLWVRIEFMVSKKWDKLIEALKAHNAENEKRFNKIETHVGLTSDKSK